MTIEQTSNLNSFCLTDQSEKREPIWPSLLVVLLLVVAVLIPPGAVTALNMALLILGLTVCAATESALPVPLLIAVIPFFVISIVGLISGVGADLYDYFKDVWYVCNPAISLSAGYFLYRMQPNLPKLYRSVIIGGLVVALIYLCPFALNPKLLSMPATESRELVGTGYYAPALAITLLILNAKRPSANLAIPRAIWWISILICGLSIVISFSRTVVIVTGIGLLANSGFFARRALLKLCSAMVAFVGLVGVLHLAVDPNSVDGKHNFLGKLTRSFDEMAVHEYTAIKDIHENYRGYEFARTLNTYSQGDFAQKVIGQGFGAVVDLRMDVRPLVGRYIPIMHNAFAYLLLKTGLLGLSLFLFTISFLFLYGKRNACSSDIAVKNGGRVLQGVAVSLAITTWVIAGVFNKIDMYPYLLCAGVIIAFLTQAVPTSEPGWKA